MKLQTMSSLPDEELHEIAMQRKGNRYTRQAIRAQEILWNRNHWGGRPSPFSQISKTNWDGSWDNTVETVEENRF